MAAQSATPHDTADIGGARRAYALIGGAGWRGSSIGACDGAGTSPGKGSVGGFGGGVTSGSGSGVECARRRAVLSVWRVIVYFLENNRINVEPAPACAGSNHRRELAPASPRTGKRRPGRSKLTPADLLGP